jgi:hypothetical protein
MALTSECEVHGWSWDPADDMGCPMCHGIAEEQERIIKLLEDELTRLNDIIDKSEYFDIPRIQFAMQILINLLNEIKGENKGENK